MTRKIPDAALFGERQEFCAAQVNLRSADEVSAQRLWVRQRVNLRRKRPSGRHAYCVLGA